MPFEFRAVVGSVSFGISGRLLVVGVFSVWFHVGGVGATRGCGSGPVCFGVACLFERAVFDDFYKVFFHPPGQWGLGQPQTGDGQKKRPRLTWDLRKRMAVSELAGRFERAG